MITLKKKFSDSYNFVHKKIVILRVDLNVPIVNGQVTDTTRVKKILPTIFKLLEHKAKIIIVSHMGRPKGKWSEEFTIEPVAKLLELLTENKIHFLRNNVKTKVF